MAAEPLTLLEFSTLMARLRAQADLSAWPKTGLAIAISGGPDSMALAWLLAQWAAQEKPKIQLHALIVDHGLRAESAREAAQVKKTLSGMKMFHAVSILKWAGKKPQTKLMEQARQARYRLMAAYCKKHGIKHLFLAHHQDDQAETFLLRLCKGSGLDGLTAMRKLQDFNGEFKLIRPVLDIPKARLVALCRKQKIAFVKDPSNRNAEFARPRLRKAQKVLAAEGLSSPLLARTAGRLESVREAIDFFADKAFKSSALKIDTRKIVMNKEGLLAEPFEVTLRVVLKAVDILVDKKGYGPRLDRMEDLVQDLREANLFRKRTLGGVIFSRDDKRGQIVMEIEKNAV